MRNWSGYLYPDSVVHKYYKSAANSSPDVEANIDSIIFRRTVEKHLFGLPDRVALTQVFDDKNIVLVHMRIGDIGSIDEFVLNKLEKSKESHSRLIVIAGVHSAWMHSSLAWGFDEFTAKSRAFEKFKSAFKMIFNSIGDFEWLSCDPDVAICAGFLSKHLFLHRGGFSSALGLASNGKVYVTNLLEHFQGRERRSWRTWEQSLSSRVCLEIL